MLYQIHESLNQIINYTPITPKNQTALWQSLCKNCE